MNKPIDLKAVRAHLLGQKSQILNKTSEFKFEQQQGTEKCLDEAELASQHVNTTHRILFQERHLQDLIQIEKALGKIESGTYGECESCGCPIDSRRLLARPSTALCIECMEEHEHTPLQ